MTKSRFSNLFTDADYAIVRSAIASLPGMLKDIVILKFWGELSIDEIAEELAISVETTKATFSRALGILRKNCMANPEFSRSFCALLREPMPLNAA